jgi:hypothetical protein
MPSILIPFISFANSCSNKSGRFLNQLSQLGAANLVAGFGVPAFPFE